MIATLCARNEPLFYFGLFCFLLALLFWRLSRSSTITIMGLNAWYKPIKFALSIGIFSWTMAWLAYYLEPSVGLGWYNGLVILGLGFEVLYIALQASKGQLSHFNNSTSFYAAMYALMAIAASLVTLGTAYLAWCFWIISPTHLPDYYLWGIRMGMLLFVIFSFEGFVMGSRMSHTIGGPDGGAGFPFLNWSRRYGDPRIAHFVGMHALQVLPLLSFYLLKSVRLTLAFAALYGLLAVWLLAQALNGKPIIRQERR
ncbi:MAG: hypothetical protein AAGD05_07315 [Bacteroidota bacterium]